MGLFGRDDAVAMEVGRLAERLARLEREVAELRATPVAAPAEAPIPERVTALIDGLSRGDAGLSRHLADEARRMLAFGVAEADVMETLYAGAIH